MKIFISHSSKDKWAARRIASDLESNGATTFLDEKDITTGESIDSAIKRHLVDCMHFLILLSPASIKSEWVLLELGGALALGKKVIPILLYVGANEIPKAISLKLARDINEVDRYYDEVEAQISGVKKKRKPLIPVKSSRSPRKSRSEFSVGDKVVIYANSPSPLIRDRGFNISWVPAMDKYLNQVATIKKIDRDGDVTLDLDKGKFGWAPEWLRKTKGA